MTLEDWKDAISAEPAFSFTTSEGESFSMTGIELADFVAFVHKLKVKEEDLAEKVGQ